MVGSEELPEPLPKVADRFGTLLKRHITIKGWTYEQTGFEVWGQNNRKSHVSAYVNGNRGEPTPKVVAKFRDALDIPQEEIDACFETAAAPVSSMPEGLSDALLENLALRFGHDNPDAGPDALTEFLKDKAKEHKALQARFAALAEGEARWANQLGNARALIDEGKFDAADAILADAEEFQQTENTLAEIRKQADLRAMRGDAALFKGDAEAAFAHYAAAADMFGFFDDVEGTERRNGYAGQLYYHSVRYGESLKYCERLFKQCLKTNFGSEHSALKAKIHSNLGGVDGFDQDEGRGECDDGAEVSGCFFAA